MEKNMKRLLAFALSLMLMFTMGTTVFAADNVEGSNDEGTVLEQDVQALDEETNLDGDSTDVDAEDVSEVVTADEGDAAITLDDGTYVMDSIAFSTAMVVTTNGNYGDVPAKVVVKGDKAYLVVAVYNPNKYDAIWIGKRADAPEDPATAEGLINGIFLADDETYTGSTDKWTDTEGVIGEAGITYRAVQFVIPFEKEDMISALSDESDVDCYAVVRRAAWSPSSPGSWMGSKDNYFTFGSLTKESDSTVLPTDEPETKEQIALVTTNEELMFKVVNSYIEKDENGAEFVFALSGNGYENVIAGTYEEAIAIGKDKSKWIAGAKADVDCDYWTERATDNPPLNHYTEGVKNKWQFRIPIENFAETGTIRIPIVAISKSRATAAENANPDNPDYSAAFTARQALINMDEKTVRTGNYKDQFEIAVINDIKYFNVQENAVLNTVGTPTANEYTCQPTLTMTDDTYDKAFVGTAEEAATAESAIEIDENKAFTFKFQNSLGKEPQIVDGVAKAAFHNASADKWIDRTFVIDTTAKTIKITGEPDNDSIAAKDIATQKAAVQKQKVTKVKVKVGKKKATVSWKSLGKGYTYKVYRAKKKSGKYTLVKTVSTNKATVKKLKKGKKYFFKVRAYKTIDGSNVYTKFSSVVKSKKIK